MKCTINLNINLSSNNTETRELNLSNAKTAKARISRRRKNGIYAQMRKQEAYYLKMLKSYKPKYAMYGYQEEPQMSRQLVRAIESANQKYYEYLEDNANGLL